MASQPAYSSRRILKEVKQLREDASTNGAIRVLNDVESVRDGKFIARVQVEIVGAQSTPYAEERFRLDFRFPQDYPFSCPAVVFLPPRIPQHPHVYSNGHICLSILGNDWSPALTTSSVCHSILSMLSSSEKKCKPVDDQLYVARASENPKESRWIYHDDKI